MLLFFLALNDFSLHNGFVLECIRFLALKISVPVCPWDWQCGELNICSGGRCQVPLCSQAANPFIPFCWGCNWTLKMWLIIHGWDVWVLTAVGVTFMTKCQPLSMSDAGAPGSRDLKWLSKIWKPHLLCFYLSYQGQSYNFCRRGVIHFLF